MGYGVYLRIYDLSLLADNEKRYVRRFMNRFSPESMPGKEIWIRKIYTHSDNPSSFNKDEYDESYGDIKDIKKLFKEHLKKCFLAEWYISM